MDAEKASSDTEAPKPGAMTASRRVSSFPPVRLGCRARSASP